MFEPAPPPPPGKKSRNGRPPLKGQRLPTLHERLLDPQTQWTKVQVPQWYGGTLHKAHRKGVVGPRVVEIATGTAIWYHTGKAPVSLRWVLVRDPQGAFSPLSLLCTDTSVDPLQIVQWFVSRWQVEVTFHEVREHLGVETQRQWGTPAIARTTPVLLGLFSLVTLLAQRLVDQQGQALGVQASDVRRSAWYQKEKPPFRMLWLGSNATSGSTLKGVFAPRTSSTTDKNSNTRSGTK